MKNIPFHQIKVLEKINHGEFATVYKGIWQDSEVAVKVFDRPDKRLKYKLWGIFDLAKDEYRKLKEIREKVPLIKDYLQEPVGTSRTGGGEPVLLSVLIRDFDDRVSRNLFYDSNITEKFAQKLREIIEAVHREKLYFLDITEHNILKKRIGTDNAIPVFIDMQRFNDFRYYPGVFIGEWIGLDTRAEKDWRRLERTLELLNVDEKNSYSR